MGLFKRIIRARITQESLGFLFARYLDLVRHTTGFVREPEDAYQHLGPLMPVIVAMWHGQHFMVHCAKRPEDKACALVSRSGDGEFNAIALRHMGVRAIRGSGARGRRTQAKGGATAMLAMVKALENGEMVVMTADVPKIARRCGEGIILLAKLSGRPIVPVSVVTSKRINFNSWDQARLGLPFSKGAMVLGEPVHVAANADDTVLEDKRQQVEDSLNAIHVRAYQMIGAPDGGTLFTAKAAS
jgi:lysophospholipid acyltransferase (LPLAT)-like uncharacterized protein